MLIPINQDLTICQNADFAFPFQLVDSETLQPINLTSATAVSLVRKFQDPSSPLILTFDVSIDVETGTVLLASSKTTNLALNFVQGFYDVLITWSDGSTDRLAQGKVTFSKGVT